MGFSVYIAQYEYPNNTAHTNMTHLFITRMMQTYTNCTCNLFMGLQARLLLFYPNRNTHMNKQYFLRTAIGSNI